YECYCVHRDDSGLGDSHVLKYSDHQEGTELETGLIGNAPSFSMQHPCVEMETQTDFEHDVGAALRATNHERKVAQAPTSHPQCDINEHESPKKELKKRANNCVELSCQSLCCDNADSPSQDPQSQAVCSDTKADVDLMAVIDYDSETGTPVCVVDVDISPRIS
ncbi:hypothetical protein M9458_022622, partial [Cirrhinus mrigala]